MDSSKTIVVSELSELSELDVLLTNVIRIFESQLAERDGLQRRRWVLATCFTAGMVELESGAMRAMDGEDDRIDMIHRIYESDRALASQSNAVQLSAIKIARLSNYVTTRFSRSHQTPTTTDSIQ